MREVCGCADLSQPRDSAGRRWLARQLPGHVRRLGRPRPAYTRDSQAQRRPVRRPHTGGIAGATGAYILRRRYPENNKPLRYARTLQAIGAYIYFADSDDTVAPTLVEDCLNAMREYDADLVMFQFDTISENNKPLLSNYRHNDFTEVQVLTPVEAIKKASQG